jgi:hypothetical protein
MKASVVNNKKMLRLSVSGCFAALMLAIAQFNNDAFFSALLYIIVEVIFIFLIMYLLAILQFARESLSVQNPFSILLGMEVVKLIAQLFFSGQMGDLLMSISITTGIIVVYILIAAFKVKTANIATPFKILGIAWLATSGLKLSALFFLNRLTRPAMLMSADLLNLVPLVAIYYIIYQMGRILNSTEISTTVSNET